MTPIEVIPGHIIETVDATIGVLCNAMTHHIEGHTYIGILQLTQRITVDPNHILHISQVGKFCTSLHPFLDRRHPRVTIDDPQTEFYSTDDKSSDSEEDEAHLN